ncbi:MAG: hypothetical protein M3Y58_12295 [Chloroflexota bacterium]|nr:hypothetical protein [Chloroflexota bacterium]
MAAAVWDDDEQERQTVTVRRVDAAYQARVEACTQRGEERGDLIAEYAAIADQMAVLARRREWSPQHIATARRLAADALRAVRLMERGE